MNWDLIEESWTHATGNVVERWGDLNDEQLAGVVQDTFGTTDHDDGAQRQLSDWEQRLNDIERIAH